jgi:hypothetical protein
MGKMIQENGLKGFYHTGEGKLVLEIEENWKRKRQVCT